MLKKSCNVLIGISFFIVIYLVNKIIQIAAQMSPPQKVLSLSLILKHPHFQSLMSTSPFRFYFIYSFIYMIPCSFSALLIPTSSIRAESLSVLDNHYMQCLQ